MAMQKRIDSLSAFLSGEDRERVTSFEKIERPHPVGLLLEREEGRSQEAVNTDSALRHVNHTNPDWLKQMHQRLVSNDQTEASSTLGELRAYGALLEAGYAVKPIPRSLKPTPEFEVTGGGKTFIVEVHSKQFDSNTEEGLRKFREQTAEEPQQPGVTSHVHFTFPFGRPTPEKSGDSTTTNAISRLCAIKQREHQLSEEIPSILWLDFQDLYTWNMSLGSEQFEAIISSKEHLTSGALWYAFYGWKGAPVFEQVHTLHLDFAYQKREMLHEGRFRSSQKVSAVVVSLPRCTFLAESPMAKNPLPPEVRLQFLGVPWAGVQHTIADWTPGLLKASLNRDATLISSFARPFKAPPIFD